MIAVYGDSWGWSYKDVDGKGEQRFFGRSLSDFLTELFNIEVTNFCERAHGNFLTIKKMQATAPLFNPGDILIVLQTDPLRSVFTPWLWKYQNTFEATPYPLVIDKPSTLKNVCDNHMLKDFYTMLANMQNEYQVEIVLHGGCSKVNRELAESLGLKCTAKTSTEVILPDFKDVYFYNDRDLANNLSRLNQLPNYVQDVGSELYAIKQVEKKYALWKSNPTYFTWNHATEAGTKLVAEYIAQYPDIDKYKTIKKSS